MTIEALSPGERSRSHGQLCHFLNRLPDGSQHRIYQCSNIDIIETYNLHILRNPLSKGTACLNRLGSNNITAGKNPINFRIFLQRLLDIFLIFHHNVGCLACLYFMMLDSICHILILHEMFLL